MHRIDVKTSEELLDWAELKNPGPWVAHSKGVAQAAWKIAENCGMDADYAYALGLIHDIGRYKGITDLKHILDGYYLMCEHGFDMAGQICITHSFPMQTYEEYSGSDDCNAQERKYIQSLLSNAQYSDYDRLIQLCDSIALPTGICLMEKRLVDVVLRHGTNNLTARKWKTMFSIFDGFQSKIGVPLYSLFPEVINNTFSF